MSTAKTKVLLTAKDIETHIADQKILDGVTFSIHQGEKVGLVGRNGSGKTTLLKILAGVDVQDNGWVEKRQEVVISYVSQSPEMDLDATVYDILLSGADQILDVINEYTHTPDDSEKKHELFETIQHADGWNLENQVHAIINKMHLPDRDKPVASLSGGEKRRLAIARSLIANPDLLILDEPTNHLDTESIEWLQDFLKKFRGACLFVTHDRYFLDEVATRILEISRGKIYSHSGGYTEYILKKAEREFYEARAEQERQKFLKKELAWIARSPQGRTTRAKGRIQRYEKIQSKEVTLKDVDVDMIIPTPPGLSDRVLDVKKVSYELSGRVLFRDITLQFAQGMRVGVVGRNGSGKSTFLKTIVGKLRPTSGTIDIAARTEVNYSDQEKLILDPESTVIDQVGENSALVHIGGRTLDARAYLKRFLFTEKQFYSLVKNLSGGETSRLILAKILKSGGNFLILDEPTNDLDLPTLRVLEEALINFDGCVLVVSHDRYFLDRVATHILGFEEDGATRFLAGDYSHYKKVKDGVLPENESCTPQVDNRVESPQKPAKIDYAKKKEIDRIERQITRLEQEVKQCSDKFLHPDLYTTDQDKIPQLTKELNEAKGKLEELYRKWEDLVG
ncbi:MAG: ABC-F family ATP-binding cassette domain-containing protein [Candidatus Dojkabacteria bacterium]